MALLIFEHIKKFPNRSLGVIAFGEAQQQAIETALRQMRKNDQCYESFFNEDSEEAFFVKNLENVQGDERDTIIFSIGYAKDAAGKFTMNFGPLSKAGGERRLNVAITRAKYNIKLVGSILPTDIDVERVSSEGPKLLRSYIDFAVNGPSAIIRETTESEVVEHDSPFERAVYNFLDRRGYKLGTQVGCSGYRIDMAVKHPSLSGRYVLGVECDGAAYHSARTARERDRLRQAVLEEMGWKIYRIWSTDWIKDPVTEGQKLIEAIDLAISGYSDNRGDDNLPIASFEEDIAPQIKYQTDSSSKSNSFLSMDEKEKNLKNVVTPNRFEKYKQTSFSDLPRNAHGDLDIADCIKAIVENEYPIHWDLLRKRIADLYGKVKITETISGEVAYYAKAQGIVMKKAFFYPAHYTTIVPRTSGNTRQIDHISTDELAEAMLVIVSNRYGITTEDLFRATAYEYGFARLGIKIWASMHLAYQDLVKNERVKETDGKVMRC